MTICGMPVDSFMQKTYCFFMNADELKQQIDSLPKKKKAKALELYIELRRLKNIEAAKNRFLPFAHHIWPDFVEGAHHRKMAEVFERIVTGESKRVIINMPPRFGKSKLSSWLFPAWFLGKFPDKKIIQASHTAELAVGFGRDTRNTMMTEEYAEIFGEVRISKDSKAAGRWKTDNGGEYFAVGVGGAMAGKGADLLIIDDPHNEQEANLGDWNPEVYDKVAEWYTSGPRQRLQSNGVILIIQTRWSPRDLTGQVLKKAASVGATDEWEVIELPAILPSGNSLWPEMWSVEELGRVKRDIDKHKWNAQYQQQPTSVEGSILKRTWWRRWDKRRLPPCQAVIQSWDTAIEKTERSDYSACTTWGVFMHPDSTGRMFPNLILIDAYAEKLEFPELKREVRRLYSEFTPDQLVVERKASGAPLLFELRSMGIPVTDFTPSRGNDKITRANAVADMFASGLIWAPYTPYAENVIEQCNDFPLGENDDLVDSTTQALIRFRQGGWLTLPSDEEPQEQVLEDMEYY